MDWWEYKYKVLIDDLKNALVMNRKRSYPLDRMVESLVASAESKRQNTNTIPSDKINYLGSESLPSENRKRREIIARSLGTHTEEEWDWLCMLCDWCCVRCGSHREDKPLTKDHVIPLSFEGISTDHISNLQPLCLNCNCWKSSRAIEFVPKTTRDEMADTWGFLWYDDDGKPSFVCSKKDYDIYRRSEGCPYKEKRLWDTLQ